MSLHPEIAKVVAGLPEPPPGPLDPVAMWAADEAQVPPLAERLPLHSVRHGRPDHVARSLAKETGHQVISVGYRLAPEAAYPAGLQDCDGVVRWAAGNTGDAGTAGDRDLSHGTGGRRPSPVTARAARSARPSPRWPTMTRSTALPTRCCSIRR